MARVLVQHLWCDVEYDEGVEVEGFTHLAGVLVPTQTGEVLVPMEVELCKEHGEAPHSQVQQWALAYGREHHAEPVPKSKPKPPTSTSVYKKARGSERLQCPYCEETRTTPGRLDRHVRDSHPGSPLGA